MPKRTFTLPSVEEPGADPIEFELSYKRRQDDGTFLDETQTFKCLPYQPAIAIRFLVNVEGSLAAVGYIERCLMTEEDAHRFSEIVYTRDVMLRSEELAEILEWLTETYMLHPTERRWPSGAGLTPTGQSSTADAPSLV